MQPVGTGPFKFKSWERGSYLQMERNADYWEKGKPQIDRLIARFIPDAGARVVAFETGEVDIGGGFPVASPIWSGCPALPSLAMTTDGFAMLGAMFYFEFNMRDPQFKDVRVRQADRPRHRPRVRDQEHLVRLCDAGDRAGLAEAGQRLFARRAALSVRHRQGRGVARPGGFPAQGRWHRFTITHEASPYDERFKRFGEYFKQAMAKIGVVVDLQESRRRRLSTTGLDRERVPDDFVWHFQYDGSRASGCSASTGRRTSRRACRIQTARATAIPKWTASLEAAQVENDPAKRKELFAQMQRLAMTDLPIIPILNENFVTLYNKRVKNHRARSRRHLRHVRRHRSVLLTARSRRPHLPSGLVMHPLQRYVLFGACCRRWWCWWPSPASTSSCCICAPGDAVDIMAGESGAADAGVPGRAAREVRARPAALRPARPLPAAPRAARSRLCPSATTISVVELILTRLPGDAAADGERPRHRAGGGVVLGVAAARAAGLDWRPRDLGAVAARLCDAAVLARADADRAVLGEAAAAAEQRHDARSAPDSGCLGVRSTSAEHLVMPAVTLGAILHGDLHPADARLDARGLAARTSSAPRAPRACPNAASPIGTCCATPCCRWSACSACRSARMLGGAVVVEIVFGWPGLGRLAFDAIFQRDLNLLMGSCSVARSWSSSSISWSTCSTACSTRASRSAMSRAAASALASLQPDRGARAGRPARLVLALAIVGPFVYPVDPWTMIGRAAACGRATIPPIRSAPTFAGRDVLAGLVHGARVSLTIGVTATCAAVVVGVVVGALGRLFPAARSTTC